MFKRNGGDLPKRQFTAQLFWSARGPVNLKLRNLAGIAYENNIQSNFIWNSFAEASKSFIDVLQKVKQLSIFHGEPT